jgi:hypothetical protein
MVRQAAGLVGDSERLRFEMMLDQPARHGSRLVHVAFFRILSLRHAARSR